MQLKPVSGFFVDYPFIFALLIMVLFTVLAMIAAVIVHRLVGRLAAKTRFSWDDHVIEALRRPVFWSVIFIGIMTALQPLEPGKIFHSVVESVLLTIMIMLWSGFIVRSVRIALRAMSDSSSKTLIRKQTVPLFDNLAFIVVVVVAIYFIFRSWDIDMTAWLASAGIVGIAIGFAAKDTLANLFSGVFILADAPYNIGDYVVLDSGERGKVTHIGIRSTRLITRDDVEITIPNAIMGNTRIINESGGPHEKYRIRVSISVAYGSDIDQVKALLMEIATSEPQVCANPEPRVRFRMFGDSGLSIDLLCWVENPELRGRVLDTLNTVIYKRFNTENIEIPYSKQDIYIKEMPR
ncbi:MAG: mechanosensitive ion channel family protein [Gammaproteobacteria bacterium]|nr:mechanosensitive ion channel family protein [Gammaproteobacteria bacterium]